MSNAFFWYALAASAHALLAVIVILARGALLRNQWLMLAGAGVLWSGMSAWSAYGAVGLALMTPQFWAELTYLAAWFAMLYRLVRGPYRQSMPETVRRFLYAFWIVVVLSAVLATWFGSLSDASLGTVASYFHVIVLAVALVVFGLAAQFKRDAPLDDDTAVSAIALGAAIAAAAQAITFGVATLTTLAPDYLLVWRSVAVALAAIGALAAARRNPQWSLDTFVSPQARNYAGPSLALFALFMLALIVMPWFRAMPPGASQSLAFGLFILFGAPIAVLLFSEQVSARLRVFVSKKFLPFRYDYREEWLRLIDTLAAPEQRLPLPERSIKAVAQIVGAPAGLLWLRKTDSDHYTFIANWNTKLAPATRVHPRDPALAFMLERQWILDTAQLAREPEMYDGLRRPEWVDAMPDALLVVPLISNEDLLGFVVLFQSSSAFRLTFEEIDLLRTSGRQVASHLAQYLADQQLAEVQQFEAFNRLTAFVMHDLKNLIAQQSLMVKNAARHKGKPEFFEDAIATIENSVARMNKLLKQLQSGEPSGQRELVAIADALRNAVDAADSRKPVPNCANVDDSLYASLEPERFAAVVSHLIRNAQESTDADGSVEVRLRRVDGRAELSIEDDGCGMPDEFIRERLFRPFDTTKGSQGMGIGAYQARTFVIESGGSLDVESQLDVGTRVVIQLPLAEPES